jgi:hypothetical protein
MRVDIDEIIKQKNFLIMNQSNQIIQIFIKKNKRRTKYKKALN